MIHDLDSTLAALLKAELPPTLVNQVAISFVAPDEQFPSKHVTPPAIDLFLYDIRENLDLRSNEWDVEKINGKTFERVPRPARVDCSYLVTTWASDGSNHPAQDEHRLLGEVVRVLLRFPTLPRKILKGGLTGGGLPLPTASLQAGRLQSLGEFWQAVGGKPRAAVHYTVTLPFDLLQSEDGSLVTERSLETVMGNKTGKHPEQDETLQKKRSESTQQIRSEFFKSLKEGVDDA